MATADKNTAKARKPLQSPLEVQRHASDPQRSIWVRANAGSGKTFVLALRVLRLLLGGTPPSALLCLTFTRAAAAEMQTRVFDRLADWAVCRDDELDADLTALFSRAPTLQDKITARRLFARAIETPGGLKIQTIHAFAERLLHQFPLEAGVPPGFSLLDDNQKAQLLQKARDQVLLAASKTASGQAHLRQIINHASETKFEAALAEVVGKREAIADLKGAYEGIEAYIERLAGLYELDPHLSAADHEAKILAESLVPEAQWPDFAAVLQTGSDKEADKAEKLLEMQKAPPAQKAHYWKQLFFKQDGDPLLNVLTKNVRDTFPDWNDRLIKEQQRLIEWQITTDSLQEWQNTASLLRLCEKMLDVYAFEKRSAGKVDFDDLINRTAALLGQLDSAWVHYKLDRGIDHILVDEAQDTSDPQWKIVVALAQDFFAGEGARQGVSRSLFVVGDEKQSIYSFMGAEPALFETQRRLFERTAGGTTALDAGSGLQNVKLNTSFRTVPEVLSVVDAVFSGPARFGVAEAVDSVSHTAQRAKDTGFVELWPVCQTQKTAKASPWDTADDEASQSHADVVLANQIAARVAQWLATGARLPSRQQAVQAGDILILVRRRNRFFDLVLKALKQAGVPVAGADRLKLSEHLAVMDMMALASVMVLPEDDLTLATVLKGPLFRFDDDALFTIGYGRKASLFEALKKSPEPRFQAAAERLNQWLEQADFASPFSFFAKVLHGEGGFETIVSQLGKDAEDPLTAFLNMALEYSLREAASLEGFIGWFNAAVQEIKRDMEQGANAVRLMTVHGAKGLEAPIVILADTIAVPNNHNKPQLMAVAMPSNNEQHLLVWRNGKHPSHLSIKADKAWLEEQFAEYNRLLYVAMTRAEDGLIVCGAMAGNAKEVNPRSWYGAVNMALSGHGEADLQGVQTLEDGTKIYGTPMQQGAVQTAPASQQKAPLPDFATQSLQQLPQAPRYLSPSSAWLEEAGEGVEAAVKQLPRTSEPNSALLRGSLTHALFQYLPALPEAEWPEKAMRYLAVRGAELDGAARDQIASEVFAVLKTPDFAPFFNAEALVEAPLIGQLQRTTQEGALEDIVVTGVIDRLVKLEDRWLILDYKTDANVPEHIEGIALPYVLQMGLYQRLLQNMAGSKKISAALLYTRAPKLHLLPDSLLDATLAKQGITAL